MRIFNHYQARVSKQKRINKTIFCLPLLITAALFSCTKSSVSNVKSNSKFSKVSADSSQSGPVDIYLAGWRSYYPSNEVAVYWKNGVLTDLTDGSRFITANSIALSGTDVYVGGNDFIDNHSIAKYWKNGNIANLTDTTRDSHTSSIAISGNDIYFAGYEKKGGFKIAKYWKNGQSVTVTQGLTDAELLSITVIGSDVYTAGWESNGTRMVAKYWKNGNAINLSDGTKDAQALSIFVHDDDIYVAGSEYIQINTCPSCAAGAIGISRIWKNGSVIKTGNNFQSFQSVLVSGNNLYIAGNDAVKACYFKDDAIIDLTNGANESEASGMGTWGNDVYVTGYENLSGHNVPTYWKNGTPNRLTNGTNNTYATAIFLSKKQ